MKAASPALSLLTLSAAVCLSLLAHAQNPAEQRRTFTTRTDLVQIDVSVLDSNRRPVRGLIPADFVVTEDGKPQQVSIFQAVDVPDPEPPPAEWMRDVTPDVTSNEARITRYWVVVVDDAMIPGALRVGDLPTVSNCLTQPHWLGGLVDGLNRRAPFTDVQAAYPVAEHRLVADPATEPDAGRW